MHTKYEYYHINKKKLLSTNSIVRFVFDNSGKIRSIYGLQELIVPDKIITNKIFYDKNWKVCSEYDDPEYYRVINLDDTGMAIGKVKDYYATGELQWEGELSYVGESQEYDVLEGECIWYYKNGNKSTVSNYENGELNGNSTDYDENGKVYSQSYYKDDELITIDFGTNKRSPEIIKNEFFNNSISNKASKSIVTSLKMEGKLRENATAISSIIAYIPKESKIEILEYYNGYYKIIYNNQKGYINELYLVENHDMLSLKKTDN